MIMFLLCMYVYFNLFIFKFYEINLIYDFLNCYEDSKN